MNNLTIAVVLCLTLGLAPFVPEPHIIGKLKWIAGGATGMGVLDYFDLIMHGAPWMWLIYILQHKFLRKRTSK